MKKDSPPTKPISIRLPIQIYDVVKRIAIKKDRDMTYILVKMLEEALGIKKQ